MFLTIDFILSLHRKLFGEVWSWTGEFRKRDKNIGVDAYQIGMQLQRLLDNARYWQEHAVYPPLETAARRHHRLVQIHPFANGNGRHARIAADALLRGHYARTNGKGDSRLEIPFQVVEIDRALS